MNQVVAAMLFAIRAAVLLLALSVLRLVNTTQRGKKLEVQWTAAALGKIAREGPMAAAVVSKFAENKYKVCYQRG